MTDDSATLASNALVPYGYAPGGYLNKCHTCGAEFGGDKRAITCRTCALERALLVSQSSRAKEKEELERQRDEEKAKTELYGEAVSLISLMRYGGIITITGDISNKLEAFLDKVRELPKHHASRPVSVKD